ncbi:MAG: hypothetical protein ACYC92_15170 [Candidatus Acidiferrales bacterium]
MTCPVCKSYVPVHSLLEATGLSGVVCPHCDSSLSPTRWSSAILLLITLLPSQELLGYLVRLHANFLISLAVFVAVFVGSYTFLAPWVIRFQRKESSILGLTHR